MNHTKKALPGPNFLDSPMTTVVMSLSYFLAADFLRVSWRARGFVQGWCAPWGR
jgi:hypothetical protein